MSTNGQNAAQIRQFGEVENLYPIPDLSILQRKFYGDFLQDDVSPQMRRSIGLESLIQETFPIESFDKTLTLEFLGYELGKPRYTPDECRQLRLTYGYPLKARVRLVKPEPVEEEVYLGEIPIMIGGGEFIVNGAERVIVSQLHRSPGVDFSMEIHAGERKLHFCWIIPERGSWIELGSTKKDLLQVRIDQSGKFSSVTLLRAMDARFSTDADILGEFYTVKTIVATKSKSKAKLARELTGRITAMDVVDLATGEVVVPTGSEITEENAATIVESGLGEIHVLDGVEDRLILNSLIEDPTKSHEEALLKIYQRLRPGNPPQIEKAKTLFQEKFFDAKRYKLGKVGRFRLNRKFGISAKVDEETLRVDDFVQAVHYILHLRSGQGEVDDIDHLGNRRVRTILELAGEEFRKGLLKLRRTAQERMNTDNPETLTPRQLINSKAFSSAVDYFFGQGELSQVVDQTNPLSQLAHERRLSALGPGGLNRKRAGFEVRDVHTSHYGRLCPIETPEGTNIGLISSLSIFGELDEFGFLVAPYRRVVKGKVSDKVEIFRADQEAKMVLAPADCGIDKNGRLVEERLMARAGGESVIVKRSDVTHVDVSPMQIVGVSASLIPFLEHDDANRALMGSNMQRQAVPLLKTDPPVVGTGMEMTVASNSGMVIRARKAGTVTLADSRRIVIDEREYTLRKFQGLNEKTCLNQKPVVKAGDKVKTGQVIADGPATLDGELSLGCNVTVAFMPWEGLNFEDAILVSEDLVRRDAFTSIHIDEFDIEIRETKLGKEEFTRDIPNVGEGALTNLDEDGIIQVGTTVNRGDTLVGKVAPKSKSEHTPEEKLLYVIFGRAGEDVKNASLEVPAGVGGIVLDTKKFSRKVNLTERARKKTLDEIRKAEMEFLDHFRLTMKTMVERTREVYGSKITDPETRKAVKVEANALPDDLRRIRALLWGVAEQLPKKAERTRVLDVVREFTDAIDQRESQKNRQVQRLSRGDELPTGVLEMAKVYLATKRNLKVGDKMAGRHGNKGVISKILPVEDMPFLEDGTPIDIVLNPLGVPSRMNVGQIMETHLGWACRKLGIRAKTPVFGSASEEDISDALEEAGFDRDGKTVLYDGRTGDPFEQKVTVGVMYVMKLHHLVDDKIHARATGPYSLITQQPLGGKTRFGGQRFGEMEVWALESYGAASILRELLTVKSDDVEGRTKMYESMVKGENILDAGIPTSFEVLTNEIRGLGLNMELVRKQAL